MKSNARFIKTRESAPDLVNLNKTGILQQTLDNYSAHGADAAFSGPIRRGDVATVRSHLSALRKMPAAREVYVALAKNAVANLPVKRQAELKKILSS